MASGGGPSGPREIAPVGDVVDKIGTTTAVNAVVLDAVQSTGLIGIGTIVNTGGVNDMVVRETVTDKYGVVNAVEHVIPAGWDYVLDPQTYFWTPGSQSRPPFIEYKVEVRDSFAGSHSTYELHYVDIGVGTGPGAGGGPPGAWTLVASGQTPIVSGATVNLASVPLPGGSPFVYVPFVTFDAPGGAPLALSQGSTLAAPPMGAVYYDLVFSGGNTVLQARSNAGTPSCTLNWALYKVVP